MPRTVPKKDRFFGLFEKLRQPDISGSFDGDLAVAVGDGCFLAQNHQPYSPVSTSKEGFHGVSFAASRSNGLHGKSETVQPASIRLLAIIKI